MLPTVRDFLTALRSMGAAAATEIEGRSVEEWIAWGGMGGSSELSQAGQRYSPFFPGCDDNSRRRKPAPQQEHITSLFLISEPHTARCHEYSKA